MKLHLIGDIHADFGFYLQWLSQKEPCDYTIQLGDFGLGFSERLDTQYKEGIIKYPNAYFIRGNHDCPEICQKQNNYLGDFGIFKNKVFFISGAWSIDYDCRTPGKDWWWNEELTSIQMEECIKLYEKIKPDYIISHECPACIRDDVVMPIGIKPTKTGLFMDELLNIHRPYKWICAHYHVRRQFNYLKTDFTVLDIKQTYSLEIND
jgi:hypothetical protein